MMPSSLAILSLTTPEARLVFLLTVSSSLFDRLCQLHHAVGGALRTVTESTSPPNAAISRIADA
jgi:hypothetical protein